MLQSEFMVYIRTPITLQAEQELKEQTSRAAKLVEKHEKTQTDTKDKNESLKALLSLYAKPMVRNIMS